MISLVPTVILREAFYPHFIGDNTEAVGLSALTEPAGGALPGVSEEPAGCLRPPDESYREVQEGSLGINALSSDNSHILSLFSLLALASSLESQKRRFRELARALLCLKWVLSFLSLSLHSQSTSSTVSAEKLLKSTTVFLFHCQP